MISLFAPRKNRFHHCAHFENVLGTSLEIQVLSDDEARAVRAENAVLDEIDRLAAIFNAYDPHSELSRWQNSFEQEIAVSRELAHVLASAESWRARTQGAFNPAVEALTRQWKRAETQGAGEPRELASALSQLQGPLWQVDAERQRACRLTRLPVTLNSIAKGFILDRAAEVGACCESVEQILVNIGGDIRHRGAKKAAIRVADPRADAENALPLARVAIRDQGIATSGDYRRGFRIGARWYSHLLDPRTGWPVAAASSVSVVAPDAMLADVLATACSVLEPQVALQLVDSVADAGVLLVAPGGARCCNAAWERLESRARR